MSACNFFHVSPKALAKWSSTDGADDTVEFVVVTVSAFDEDDDVSFWWVKDKAGESTRAAATWGGDCSGGLTGLKIGFVVKACGMTTAAGGVGVDLCCCCCCSAKTADWFKWFGVIEAIGWAGWTAGGGGGVGVGVGDGVDGTGDFFPKRAT